ncbi:hypothetical protein KYK30_10520 [Shinella yambaruensis]|uniref:DUF3426 domain-containing protein n=1 Tax=Shinella yambaruensis TaxID=415996 RepID=A0ABQ5ZDN4_9HYPH|nr:hypothetical protein [Shinella yambaruensis]MCJ8028058.1 hypothetical protein [Shinella yambaruensis]MCU7980128.1 hypothetical protein [Shinella yambaruensis]GLR48894.1 hypothetical protein GCM10007923_00980 [Shinella yambaruensis]
MNAFRARREAKGRIDLLPPEPKTPARRNAKPFPARLEVVDADFVVIRSTAARTSNDNHRPARPTPADMPPRHLLLRVAAAGGRLCEAGLQRLPGRAFAGLVTAAFIFVFAYAGGLSALRAALPASTPGGALRIADVITTVDDRNGMKVLAVYGRLTNGGNTIAAVPPVDIVFERMGKAIHHRLSLETAKLAPGASETFALRIPHNGGKVPKVSVSLAAEGAPAP